MKCPDYPSVVSSVLYFFGSLVLSLSLSLRLVSVIVFDPGGRPFKTLGYAAAMTTNFFSLAPENNLTPTNNSRLHSSQTHHLIHPLDIEHLLENAPRVVRVLDRVALDAWVCVYLPIVAALESLVTEEMDFAVRDAVGLLSLVLEVSQAVRLVPSGGEHVEGELAADGISVW